MTFDDDVELALAAACEELQMTRDELIRLIMREWLEGYGFLPVHELDEGSETEVSGFTDEERAAEMKRRDDAIKLRHARDAAWRHSWLPRADTRCLHCGNPMSSWEATDPEIPLCDICL